ncbi:hypothetical protein EC991_008144, partial [Linnemannia zychae]
MDNGKEQTFIALKAAICSAPVLRIFEPDLRTTVGTDASGLAIVAILFQTDASGVPRP